MPYYPNALSPAALQAGAAGTQSGYSDRAPGGSNPVADYYGDKVPWDQFGQILHGGSALAGAVGSVVAPELAVGLVPWAGVNGVMAKQKTDDARAHDQARQMWEEHGRRMGWSK